MAKKEDLPAICKGFLRMGKMGTEPVSQLMMPLNLEEAARSLQIVEGMLIMSSPALLHCLRLPSLCWDDGLPVLRNQTLLCGSLIGCEVNVSNNFSCPACAMLHSCFHPL